MQGFGMRPHGNVNGSLSSTTTEREPMSEKTMKELTAEKYLEISQKEAAKALDRVMAEFDFDKAARALHGCGWKYQGAAESPSAIQLKKIAKDITMRAIQSGSRCTIGAGPLRVETGHHDTPAVVSVTLSLMPVHSYAVYIDGRVIFAKKQRRFKSAK